MKKILSKFNYLFILVFTGLIWFGQVQGVVLYSGAANQVVYENQTFVLDWFLDTQGAEINTLFLKLNFSRENLEVVSVSPGGSALNLWIQPPKYSNETETIELTGGITGGVKSNRVPLFSVTVKPLVVGSAKISMDESSTVLLSDGEGTSAALSFNQLGFNINPASSIANRINSSTHPDPDKWYKDNRVVIDFERKSDEEYSYSFSSNLEIIPDQQAENMTKVLAFENLPDGVYYFKLNSRKFIKSALWQEAGVYRVQIDSTPPQQFTPTVLSDLAIFEGKPFLSLSANDKVSGVTHYEIRYGYVGVWERTETPLIKLPGLVLGDAIEVKAVDAAGNEAVKTIKIKDLSNTSLFQRWFIWFIWFIITVVVLLASVAYVIYKKISKRYKI